MTGANSRSFRTDINGLRAWAVLAVVLYHFAVPGFSGGFVGVDLFFVISGFLMTQIIVSGLDSERGFSIWRFYLARARRIIPALITICAALMAAGWFLLPAHEYRLLSNHVISSLAFISNMKYWREAGYFDPASHEKWLLHTWTLSVEWQFYLLLPVFLLIVWRLRPGRGTQTFAIWGMFALSLGLSVAVSPWKPVAAFYLLPTRVWELVAGGLVYLYCGRVAGLVKYGRGFEWVGLALITASITFLDTTVSWPGAWALLPVTGTALVLAAERPSSPMTGGWALQWIGARSYSIYLWHWPVVVLLVYLDLTHAPVPIAVGIAASMLLGHASYVLVENPTRAFLQLVRWRTAVAGLLCAALAVVLPAFAVRTQDGINGRLSAAAELAFNEAADKNPRMQECHVAGPTPVPQCTYGGPELGAIVIGDSHAASFVRTVEQALPTTNQHVLDWTMSACPTLAGVKKVDGQLSPNCGQFVRISIHRSRLLPKHVPLIVVNRASFYAFGPTEVDGADDPVPSIYFDKPFNSPTAEFLREYRAALIDTACEFNKSRPVFLVRPIPEMPVNVPNSLGRALVQGRKYEIGVSLGEYFKRNRFIWDAQDAAVASCGVKILDPLPYLCPSGECMGAKDGRPLYYDDDHLSEFGASQLMPMFDGVFARVASAIQVPEAAKRN